MSSVNVPAATNTVDVQIFDTKFRIIGGRQVTIRTACARHNLSYVQYDVDAQADL